MTGRIRSGPRRFRFYFSSGGQIFISILSYFILFFSSILLYPSPPPLVPLFFFFFNFRSIIKKREIGDSGSLREKVN